MVAVFQFLDYLSECAQWSAEILWNSLWDQKTFVIFLLFWIVPVFKSWRQLGWKSAGFKFLQRGIMAMKALRWPAMLLVGVFGVLLILVAPAYKFFDMKNFYIAEQSKVTDLQSKISIKEADLDSANTLLVERRQAIDQLQEANEKLQSENQALRGLSSSKKSQDLERKKHRDAREQLAHYIELGEELKQRCREGEEITQLMKDGDLWAQRVATYLVAKFDSSYFVQFKHPPQAPPIGHAGMSQKHDNLWINIDRHVGVLRKFISEIKD
jgi:hypothetical protein